MQEAKGGPRSSGYSHPQGSYMMTGQQMIYGSSGYGAQGGSMYGESQAMGYNLSSGRRGGLVMCVCVSGNSTCAVHVAVQG